MKIQIIFKYIGIGIIAMLLAMCNAGGNTGDTGGDTTIDINTYTFSYEATPQGQENTLLPKWAREVPVATYEISHGTPAPGFDVKVPTIDESTGTVDIAVNTTEGVYTITATGTGNYKGTATAKVYVTVTPAPTSADTTGKAALTTAINAGITAWGNEGDFNYIITTSVTDMSNLFIDHDTADNVGYQLFNGDISQWNTSTVTTMEKMFYAAKAFNQPIGNWNTSKVENMSEMFLQATAFNQPIGNWNTSAVKNMSSMFNGATLFNQDIKTVIDPAGDGSEAGKTDDDRWNTSKVENMQSMFSQATAFNQPIGNWNTSKVGNMSEMFLQATAFNQPIGNWNTNRVTNMYYMFSSASAFNQDIKTVIDPAKDGNDPDETGDDRWNTSAVKNMYAMFWKATLFNKKIDNWNVGAVETGKSTFMFTNSGMTATPPCWYNSSGNGAIRVPRPATDCAVAD